MTFTEKWNTDNTLGTEIAIQDKIAQGLKLTFDSTFAPQTGYFVTYLHYYEEVNWNVYFFQPNSKKTGIVKAEYKHDTATLNADVDLNGGPTINGAAVCGYLGWLAGYQMSFDMSKSQLTRNNFSIAYAAKDFALHTNV